MTQKLSHFILFLIIISVTACATYEPRYAEKDESQRDTFPENPVIERSFYLIGDAGISPDGSPSDGLQALSDHINDSNTEDDFLVFLGDNIYPSGLPPEDDKNRKQAERYLSKQLDVAEKFKGRTIYIPGNHEYYDGGLDNLEREEEYIEKRLKDENIWKPKVGCPLEIVELDDEITVIVVDSQWYLAKWDDHPTINDDCEEIKTRKKFFIEIETELKKNAEKTIVFALHHPLYTNGVHGGQFAFQKHLFPTQQDIPLPGLASLVTLIRTSGGVSAQDKQNRRYQDLVNRITALARASNADRLIFASGHEHTLQYIENDGIKQIVSGSGSKKSYVVLAEDGQFAYGDQGFARLDVMKDGSSYVRFYGLGEDGKAKLLYTKKAIDRPEPYDTESLPDSFPAFAKARIYPEELVEKGNGYESIWGKKYREIYGIEVTAPVADLDTLYGGLTAAREGGGHQTRSIRLIRKDGRQYNMRALKKSAIQFLQTVIFKTRDVEEEFEETAAEDLLYDFYTAAHPYAAFVVPRLSDAVGVYHTNPKLFYIPKQPALGDFNSNHGDELYMIVERPEDNHIPSGLFGEARKIESTSDLYEHLRRDEKYQIDEDAFIRARLFDMLIGDWDRHQDQWRWTEREQPDGSHLFFPIPRDRDQVFSNFDGALFGALRTMVGMTKQFAVYGDDLENLKWFNLAANDLDRTLIQTSTKDDWIAQAEHLQNNLSDEAIEEAFKAFPEEIQDHESTRYIKESLRKRRGNMVDIASRYYDYLAQLSIVTGTDKDDFIIIERVNDGQTDVTIYRNKDGEMADIVKKRTFLAEETDEIWIYALDDDDIIRARGDADNKIRIRVIGGQNNDIYEIEEGSAITLYDHKTKPNTIKDKANANLRLSDDYEQNIYDHHKNKIKQNAILPAIGFNPDDGVRLGLQDIYTVKGFNQNPFTQRHKFRAGYYFATSGFDLDYSGEFAGIFNHVNLLVKAGFASPNFAENFFGFGNETVNPDDELDRDFNRVKISTYELGTGIQYRGEYGSNIRGLIEVRGRQVEATDGRFITDFVDPDVNEDFYDRKWFADLNGTYNYESYDNELNPTRGMIFEVTTGGIMNMGDTERYFGYLKSKMGFYNALSQNRKWVLRTLAQSHLIWGDDFEFYQGAALGQNTGLRGYRFQRFIGQRSFATSADIRYSFDSFKTAFVPLQMGVFAGGDVGRVWLDGDDSQRWHNDYGGGIWINSTDAIGATFNLFHGADGFRFSFNLGFSF